ncbi:MAG: hypothetical protein LBK71_02075 [Verrucomicrobiales bacterium]|jgi:hypothetical protein|nr:hypothetical protein [Verrucomicrobiales bacterium]
MPLAEILVVHHTHTDWGYTSHPSVVEARHYRYIDQAVDLCRRYREQGTSSRYRWTCESAWVVHGWLKSRSPRERRALLDCVRRGEIEVAAMPLHPTPLADSRTIAAALRILDELRAEGIPISVALICDINGLSWPWADALLDHGVTTLCAAMNFVCGGGLPRYTAFQWQSASGRKLLCWQGAHYNQGAFWGINYDAPQPAPTVSVPARPGNQTIDAGATRRREVDLAKRLAELKDYPYEKLLLQVTNVPPDNGPPHPQYLDYIAAYNRQARLNEWPMMRPATLLEWANYLFGHAAGLPVFAGDWTDWWASGVASTPRETAALMEAQRRIHAAEQRGLPVEQAAAVRRKIFLAAEHTWGGSTSALKPYELLSLAGLAAKQELMYAAVVDANEALRASLQPRYRLLDTRLESFDPLWNELVRGKADVVPVQPLRKVKAARRKVDWQRWINPATLKVILEEPLNGERSTWFEVGKFDRPEAHGHWNEAPRWKRTVLKSAHIDWDAAGDTVRIEARVKLDYTERPRSLYILFPFGFQASLLADVGGAWADPCGENIPGSCKNWWTVHRGILLRGRAASVLWTPWDAPLVMFDEPCPTPPRKRNPRHARALVSWPINTYWFTNFCGLSGGDYTFRYRLKWWPGVVSMRDVEGYCASDPLADYPQVIAVAQDTVPVKLKNKISQKINHLKKRKI